MKSFIYHYKTNFNVYEQVTIKMSDSEAEYAIETKNETQSELEYEEDDVTEEEEADEYDYAIERYAEMIRDVPLVKLDGFVERIEELFENPYGENDVQGDNICRMVVVSLLVMLLGSVIKLIAIQKTDYSN
jgi:hypothetical protein